MWEHDYSGYGPAEVRRGLEERNSAFIPQRGMSDSNQALEIQATRMTGVQKEGIAYDALIGEAAVEHRVWAGQIQNPIVSTLDFYPSYHFRGNFEVGCDLNDFVTSEYGAILQADPFRTPKEVMIDNLREQNYPDAAFSRQDLANRYFLMANIESKSMTTQSDIPDEIKGVHHRMKRKQAEMEQDQALVQRQDAASLQPAFAERRPVDPAFRRAAQLLAVASQAARYASTPGVNMSQGAMPTTPARGRSRTRTPSPPQPVPPQVTPPGRFAAAIQGIKNTFTPTKKSTVAPAPVAVAAPQPTIPPARPRTRSQTRTARGRGRK